MKGLESNLRKTRALLLAVSFGVLVVSVLTLWRAFVDVFPSCIGTLEPVDANGVVWDRGDSFVVTLDDERGGPVFHVDKDKDLDGSVVSARLLLFGIDANGRRCECGRIALNDAGVSAATGTLRRDANGIYRYVDGKWGDSPARFRLVDRPGRHLQRDRLPSSKSLPAVLVLLAICALAIAAWRASSAVDYVTRISGWTEAQLDADGRVASEDAGILGVVDTGLPSLGPRVALVAPGGREGRGAYRDVPSLPRRDVAIGSHDDWRAATLLALRSARALTGLGATCATLAVLLPLLSS